jgi:hypothetical protein
LRLGRWTCDSYMSDAEPGGAVSMLPMGPGLPHSVARRFHYRTKAFRGAVAYSQKGAQTVPVDA